MSKLVTSKKKDTKEQLKDIAKNHPKQVEKEIFPNINSQGFNFNPSEQQNYPGPQKHEKKISQKKAK